MRSRRVPLRATSNGSKKSRNHAARSRAGKVRDERKRLRGASSAAGLTAMSRSLGLVMLVLASLPPPAAVARDRPAGRLDGLPLVHPPAREHRDRLVAGAGSHSGSIRAEFSPLVRLSK